MAKEEKIKVKALNDLIDAADPFIDDFLVRTLQDNFNFKLTRDFIIAAVVSASMGEGGKFNLGNGLPATIYRLDNPRISNVVEIIKKHMAKEIKTVENEAGGTKTPRIATTVLAGQLGYLLESLGSLEQEKHYVVAVRVKKTTIYLIYPGLKHPMKELLLLRKNLPSGLGRALAIVYEDTVYRLESRSGGMIVKAILKKTNPKIAALMG